MTQQLKRKLQHDFEVQVPGVHILQSRQARFHNIISPMPAIIWVLSGTKRVSSDREIREVLPDYFVLLPENRAITIENIPQAHKPYEARVLALERKIFEAAYKRIGISEDQRKRSFQVARVSAPITDAFLFARSALLNRAQLPPSVFLNRCEEVVLWLADAGACLPLEKPASFADRVRNVISQNPSFTWTSGAVGIELAVSEATLRRKLHAEGTSFKKILLELRMLVALTYLQTTNWQISKIAEMTGYASQSRFSGRFRERFGMNPRDLRKPKT